MNVFVSVGLEISRNKNDLFRDTWVVPTEICVIYTGIKRIQDFGSGVRGRDMRGYLEV